MTARIEGFESYTSHYSTTKVWENFQPWKHIFRSDSDAPFPIARHFFLSLSLSLSLSKKNRFSRLFRPPIFRSLRTEKLIEYLVNEAVRGSRTVPFFLSRRISYSAIFWTRTLPAGGGFQRSFCAEQKKLKNFGKHSRLRRRRKKCLTVTKSVTPRSFSFSFPSGHFWGPRETNWPSPLGLSMDFGNLCPFQSIIRVLYLSRINTTMSSFGS